MNSALKANDWKPIRRYPTLSLFCVFFSFFFFRIAVLEIGVLNREILWNLSDSFLQALRFNSWIFPPMYRYVLSTSIVLYLWYLFFFLNSNVFTALFILSAISSFVILFGNKIEISL